MTGTALLPLGFDVDTAPLADAAARLDALGISAQKSGGYLLATGNAFRNLAAANDVSSASYRELTQTWDKSAVALDQITGRAGEAGKAMVDSSSQSVKSVGELGRTLSLIPASLMEIEHGADGMARGIARAIDITARGISDIRTIRSVFAKDTADSERTTGTAIAETAKHYLELQLATTGLNAVGAESAATFLLLASRLSLYAGGVAAVGLALADATSKAKNFEAESKGLENSLKFTNSASGMTSAGASSLIDTATGQTGLGREALAEAMQELIKARNLGQQAIRDTFALAAQFADRSGQDVKTVIAGLISSYEDLGAAGDKLEAIGVNLTAEERRKIDTLVEAKDKSAAYKVVLQELAAQNQEYAVKLDSSTESQRRFAAESDEMLRNIGQGWRDLLSYFALDLGKYLFDPVRDALSEIMNMVNAASHPTVSNLEKRLGVAQKGLSATEGLASGADSVMEGQDYGADVAARRKEVTQLTAALNVAKEAEKSLKSEQGEKRQASVVKYKEDKAASEKEDTTTTGSAEVDRVAKLIEALQHEKEMLGQTERARAIDTELRKADGEATEAQASTIRTLAGALFDAQKAEEKRDAARKEGKVLTEKFGDAEEQYAEKLKHLNELLGQGAIDFDTFEGAQHEAEIKMLENSDDFFSGVQAGWEKYADDAGNAAKQGEKLFSDAAAGMTKTFETFVKTGKMNFQSLTDAILSDLMKIMINKAIVGPLGEAFGSIFGGGGQTADNPQPSPERFGDAFSGGNVIPFARGGTFSNSIVSQPTLFPMASGSGLMGEAGPEAVMPLTRASDGSLGVRAAPGKSEGGGGVNIQIIDNRTVSKDSGPGEGVRVQDQGKGPDGKQLIQVIVQDAVSTYFKSGNADQMMKQTYSAQRRPIGR